MPIYSMTGYASNQMNITPGVGAGNASSTTNQVSSAVANHQAGITSAGVNQTSLRIGLEIRAVNSRFLDVTLKLTDELREFEPILREMVNAQLKRGKVEVKASLITSDTNSTPEPSTKLLQRLSSIEDNVRVWLPKATPLSVAEVLRLSSGLSVSTSDISPHITRLMDDTLKDLLASRSKEGARLAAAMLQRTQQLKELAQKVEPLLPQIIEQQRLRFLERWNEALKGAALQNSSQPTDPSKLGPSLLQSAEERALTEAASFAVRIDVAEELTRLNSHLQEIELLLSPKKSSESLGKRLDFLIQELHREANTLGSKASSLELTRIGVDMKVLIEQLREQVQNIE